MSDPTIQAPGGFVPRMAVSFGDGGGSARAVDEAHPLPVAVPDAMSDRSAGRDAAVIPSDTGEIEVTRALYVDGGGAITVRLEASDADWTLGVDDRSFLPFRVRAVRAAGTTATGIRALY